VGSCGIAVYVALALHAGADSQTCWPSYRTLARLAGISRYQAMRAVKHLERHNLIRAVRHERNQTNLYVLPHPDQWCYSQSDSEGAEVVNLVDSAGGGSQPERPPGVSEVDHLGLGSHNGRPGGVTTSDSNKTHEQYPGEEQDEYGVGDSLSPM
jgi:hypothetical protein